MLSSATHLMNPPSDATKKTKTLASSHPFIRQESRYSSFETASLTERRVLLVARCGISSFRSPSCGPRGKEDGEPETVMAFDRICRVRSTNSGQGNVGS